jgi:hypothetical protein
VCEGEVGDAAGSRDRLVVVAIVHTSRGRPRGGRPSEHDRHLDEMHVVDEAVGQAVTWARMPQGHVEGRRRQRVNRKRVCAKSPLVKDSTFVGATANTNASPPSWRNMPSRTSKSQSP